MTEPTPEAPRRFRSKTAATAAYNKDRLAFQGAHNARLLAFWTDLRAKTDNLPAPLDKIAELHSPWIEKDPTYFNPSCPACSGCCDSEDAPCDTLEMILEHALPPDHPKPPYRHVGQMPHRFEDYWPDPCVVVTMAHHTTLRDRATGQILSHLVPNEQVTLKHSLAYELRGRLMTTSRERVEAMS